MPVTVQSETSPREPLDPALIKLALVILVGVIAAILDLTVVNVAIATLQTRLHASVSTIQWVVTGYGLAVCMTIPVSGWVFDRLGARRAWLLSLIIFVVGSVLCGLAWSVGSLIAFRVVQGVGGGLLLPLAQTILADAAGRERLARIVPFIAIPSQLGPVLGPVLGGLILSHASWRWIFYINVPIVLVAIVLAWRTVPRTTARSIHRLDVLGLALLAPGLALLVYGFSEAGVTGGFDQTRVLIPLIGGTAVVAGYCFHDLRTRVEPILNLRYFRVRGYATASVLNFLSGIMLFGVLFLLPLYYQEARGASALRAGLLLAPQGIGVMCSALVASRLVVRTGCRLPALIGLSLLAVATAPYVFAGEHTSEAVLSLVLFVRGIGLGLALIPLTTASYIGLPHSAIPRVTTGVRVFQQVGGALGTAILAVILQHSIAGSGNPDTVAHAFDITFLWILGLTLLSLVPAALLPGRTSATHAV